MEKILLRDLDLLLKLKIKNFYISETIRACAKCVLGDFDISFKAVIEKDVLRHIHVLFEGRNLKL